MLCLLVLSKNTSWKMDCSFRFHCQKLCSVFVFGVVWCNICGESHPHSQQPLILLVYTATFSSCCRATFSRHIRWIEIKVPTQGENRINNLLNEFVIIVHTELSDKSRSETQRGQDSAHEQRIQRAWISSYLRPLHREGSGRGAGVFRGWRCSPGPQRWHRCL